MCANCAKQIRPGDHRRVRNVRVLVLIAAVLVGASGCADPLTKVVTAESAPPSISITQANNNDTLELVLGQTVFIESLDVPLDDIYIESDDTAIVFPVQPTETDGPPGLLAIGPGGARVSVWETFPTNQGQVPVMTLRVLVSE